MNVLPIEVVTDVIFMYVPLIELYSLAPKSTTFENRISHEWKDFEPYLNAIEEDNLDFLLLLLSHSDRHPIGGRDLLQLIFSSEAKNITDAVFEGHVLPTVMFLEELIEHALDRLSPKTIMSFSDKHFIKAMKYSGCSGDMVEDEHYLCQLGNFDVLETFLRRILNLNIELRSTIPWFIRNHYWNYDPKVVEKYLDIPKHIEDCCHTEEYPRRPKHRCDNVDGYREYLRSLEQRKYQPEIYNDDNYSIYWLKRTKGSLGQKFSAHGGCPRKCSQECSKNLGLDLEVLIPKLIEAQNFNAIWTLLKSDITTEEEKLIVDKYLSKEVDGYSLLSHLLSSEEHHDWDLLLSLPSAPSVPNLLRDLTVTIEENYYGCSVGEHVAYIRSFVKLPQWFNY